MIGKPEWFTRRKYLGWGIMPKTWQGGAYFLLVLAPLFALPYFEMTLPAMIAVGAWFIVFTADLFHIMATLPSDERDSIHEAFAERNALWAMILVLAVGLGFVIARETVQGNDPFENPAILMVVIALFAGVAVKAGTNYWLDRND